jgi:uncharacterized protein YqeY
MLYEVIKQKHVEAMKARNPQLKSVYGNILAKIMVAEKSGKYSIPLEDSVVESLIQKEVKELQETAEGFANAGRSIEAGAVYFQIDEIKQYLPKMLTELEVESMIAGYVAASGETNKGKITGAIAKMVGNRFDKSKIKGIVDREV